MWAILFLSFNQFAASCSETNVNFASTQYTFLALSGLKFCLFLYASFITDLYSGVDHLRLPSIDMALDILALVSLDTRRF